MIPCTLVHSDYDPSTAFASSCALDVKKMLVSAEFQIFELPGRKANRTEVHKHLKGFLATIHGFFIYGHGNERTLFGHNDDVLLDMKSAGLLKNKICYALSCSAARELGKEVISSGGICFTGFNGDFTFLPSREEIFKTCVNSGLKAMIKDKVTTKEAFEITKAKFVEMMSVCVQNGNDELTWLLISTLLIDRDYLELLGNGAASLW